MPEQPSDRTDLKAQYAAQLAADLEANAKEREHIDSEIAALRTRLIDLEQESGLLLGMQEALVTGPAERVAGPGPEKPPAGRSVRASARLPVARRAPGVEAPVPEPGRAAKVAGPRSSRAAGRPAPGGATLRDLVAGLLAAHDGPRSAAEVTDALARSRPGREVSATVVRNTLEALVAKGRAHRSKEQKSVFYSATAAAQATKEPLASE